MQYVVVLSGDTQDVGNGLSRRHSLHVPYKVVNVNSSRSMGQFDTVVPCFHEGEQKVHWRYSTYAGRRCQSDIYAKGFRAEKSTPRVFLEVQKSVTPTWQASTKPVSRKMERYSSTDKHPVTQLLHPSPTEHETTAEGLVSTVHRSDKRNLPPGLSPRNDSAKAARL
jgi:hypothetical protein